MAEMALTADRLVVIGRGRLLADTTVTEFVACASGQHAKVRSSDQSRLATALSTVAGTVASADDEALLVKGLAAAQVGQIAHDAGVVVHELYDQRASLEEAFMALTADSVQFHGHLNSAAPAPTDTIEVGAALVGAGTES